MHRSIRSAAHGWPRSCSITISSPATGRICNGLTRFSPVPQVRPRDARRPRRMARLVIAPSTSPENSYIDPKTVETNPHHVSLHLSHEHRARVVRCHRAFRRDSRSWTPNCANGIDPDPSQAAAHPDRPGRPILEWAQPYKEANPATAMFPTSSVCIRSTNSGATRRTCSPPRARCSNQRIANGGGGTGWSRAWSINFFARLLDGDAARGHYLTCCAGRTLPNLFDNCPAVPDRRQFRSLRGLTEMLVQSHERVAGSGISDQAFVIDLLPALPDAWASGSVKGLRTRGGFTVDLEWKDHQLVNHRITSKDGRKAGPGWMERSWKPPLTQRLDPPRLFHLRASSQTRLLGFGGFAFGFLGGEGDGDSSPACCCKSGCYGRFRGLNGSRERPQASIFQSWFTPLLNAWTIFPLGSMWRTTSRSLEMERWLKPNVSKTTEFLRSLSCG